MNEILAGVRTEVFHLASQPRVAIWLQSCGQHHSA